MLCWLAVPMYNVCTLRLANKYLTTNIQGQEDGGGWLCIICKQESSCHRQNAAVL
jgi:hypothetical protein